MKHNKFNGIFKLASYILLAGLVIVMGVFVVTIFSTDVNYNSLYDSMTASKSNFTKKLTFVKSYVTLTGDYSFAYGIGYTDEEVGNISAGTQGDSVVKDDEETSGSGPSSSGSGNGIPVPTDLQELINMSFEDAFKLCMNDSNANYDDIKNWNTSTQNYLNNIKSTCAQSVTVDTWQWASKGSTSLEKKSVKTTFTVNRAIAPLVQQIFKEIYEHPDKPIIYNGGGWNVRNMASNASRTSGHAFGCAIDLQPSSTCNGYTNNQTGSAPYVSTQAWNSLPDCQAKYEVFYESSPVVCIFKKYGFQWGGDWSTKARDGMHFSFLGDNGKSARTKGQENARQYANY